MSEVAGRMSIQAGAAHLEKSKGGMGLLLGGVPGAAPAHIVIIGRCGRYQCDANGSGTGARVTVLDKSVDRLRQLDLVYGNRISTVYPTHNRSKKPLPVPISVIGGVWCQVQQHRN